MIITDFVKFDRTLVQIRVLCLLFARSGSDVTCGTISLCLLLFSIGLTDVGFVFLTI